MSDQAQDISMAQDHERPFLGLRSFEEDNKAQFGGRDKEIEELYELIEENGLTVVFGKSGIGKTSLLRAGLMPKLRTEFYFPIYIRIDYNTTDPLSDLKTKIYDTLSDKDPDVEKINGRSLWEYFHDMNFSQGLVKPVLIVDQFEEIFTLGENNPGVKQLLGELADLAENRIPVAVQNHYKEIGETVPTRYSTQSYRVALSLREDFLPRLEEIKQAIPDIMDNRFRVVQMTISQAMEAAIKPGKGLIDEEAAREIIAKLPGISENDFHDESKKGSKRENYKVEPFLLSFICDRMNEERIAKGQKTFTAKLVKNFEVEDAIRSFYNDTLNSYPISVEHGIEDLLLTQGGFRKLQALGELQNKYNISDDVIDELIQARILRKESRDNIDYVELIHDVLTGVIKEKRDKRIEEEEERERLETLRLERAKNRKRMIRIGSVLGVFLIGFIAVSAWQRSEILKTEEQNARKAKARELLLSAVSTSIYSGTNNGNAALLAKYAYELYNKDRVVLSGINENDAIYYHGMLKSSFDLQETIKNMLPPDNTIGSPGIGTPDGIQISALAPVNKASSDYNFYETFEELPKEAETAAEGVIAPMTAGRKSKKVELFPTAMEKIDHLNGYIFGLKDNSVRLLTLENNSININKAALPIAGHGLSRVKDIDYDNIKKRTAFARDYDIHIYEQDITSENTTIWANLKFPFDPEIFSIKSKKTHFIRFMPDHALVGMLGKKLYHWDNTFNESPTAWNERPVKRWRLNDSIPKLEPNKTQINVGNIDNQTMSDMSGGGVHLEFDDTAITFSVDASAIAVSKKSVIALSFGYRVVLIYEDAIHEIEFFRKWKEVTSMSFNPTGDVLVLGNKKGDVLSLDLPEDGNFDNVDLRRHFAHNKKVLDIQFSSANPNKFASTSQDGSVAVWTINTDEKGTEVWSALILDSSIYGLFNEPARNVSFSLKGGYVIVVYDNGTVIKWPSSLDKLQRLICEKHQGRRLSKIIKKENNLKEADSAYWRCETE